MANETITGKIFQLKDPSNSYNRFPRTVMEAVYGLNTYLQNQFSALADIYMPIEGITESKPLQEFVYRACPSSIKAKSVSLDRIYGKTLAWNQLIQQSVFSNTANGITISSDGSGKITIIVNNPTAFNQISVNVSDVVSGHKYYCRGWDYFTDRFEVYNSYAFPGSSNCGPWVITAQQSGSISMNIFAPASLPNGTYYIYPELIDVTLLSSEIASMEGAEIAATIDALYPGYHDYSAGTLISNDAESIETVGFNQFDESLLISGKWRASNGSEEDYTGRRRSDEYSTCLPNTQYFVKGDGNSRYSAVICWYDVDKNFISGYEGGLGEVVTSPQNAAYFRMSSADLANTIVVNLSNSAKNGTYEPYRKSTMQLGLGSFQVRDSQGNVTTITGGLKSAGSVRDEIVGNKYIKRVERANLGGAYYQYDSVYSGFFVYLVGSKDYFKAVCSKYPFVGSYSMVNDKQCGYIYNTNLFVKDSTYGTDVAAFASAMEGVYVDYELATPIEYTLVSPLVTTVKAGITEARISPNADGLSAPMVADMTYSAGQSEDATQAQYATVAGRLYNTHKLWGQDFDGTQDVSGALTGVTNLNSLLYFGSTNVGIGQPNPQYKLDVSGTARVTGAATLGSTLSVSGNSTIGGTLTVTWDTTLNAHLTVYDDAIFHSDLYLYAGMALYLDQGGNNALYYDASEGTIRFAFDYASHFTDGVYSDSFITAGGVNASSDARLKDNLAAVSAEKALSVLMQLRPMEWVWNEKNAYLEGKIGAGLVAQEVESVLPFAVSHDTEYLSLNYNVFHAYEIAGLQNHEERIKALEKENAELKAKVEQLKMR